MCWWCQPQLRAQMPRVLSLKSTWLIFFSLRQYYTLLSPSFAQRERCCCFQRVSIHVIFQTLTGSQGTPPLPLFDVNNTDAHSQEMDTHTALFFLFLPPSTGGVVFTVCFLSRPRLLSAKGVIRLRQPNGWGWSNLWGVSGSPEEAMHARLRQRSDMLISFLYRRRRSSARRSDVGGGRWLKHQHEAQTGYWSISPESDGKVIGWQTHTVNRFLLFTTSSPSR